MAFVAPVMGAKVPSAVAELAHLPDGAGYAAVEVGEAGCYQGAYYGLLPHVQGYRAVLVHVGDGYGHAMRVDVGPVICLQGYLVHVVHVCVRLGLVVWRRIEGQHSIAADAEDARVGPRQRPDGSGRIRARRRVGLNRHCAVLRVVHRGPPGYRETAKHDVGRFVHVGDHDGYHDGGAFPEGVLGRERDLVAGLRLVVQLRPSRHFDLTTLIRILGPRIVLPDPELTRISAAQRVNQRVCVGIGVHGHDRAAHVVRRCVSGVVGVVVVTAGKRPWCSPPPFFP